MLGYYGLKSDSTLKINLRQNEFSIQAGDLFGYVLRLSESPKFYFFKLLKFYSEDKIYTDKISEMSRPQKAIFLHNRLQRLLRICSARATQFHRYLDGL